MESEQIGTNYLEPEYIGTNYLESEQIGTNYLELELICPQIGSAVLKGLIHTGTCTTLNRNVGTVTVYIRSPAGPYIAVQRGTTEGGTDLLT